MSNVTNEPRIKNPLIVAIREQLEHRALWLWLLWDESQKKGSDPTVFAPPAISRCGAYQGKLLVEKGGTRSLRGLRHTLFGKFAQWVFEMKIRRCDDDHLDIDFHYCPLVKAWQKQDCTDEQLSALCDCAMCGDRAIAASYGCELDLPRTIANGDDICELRFVRRKSGE